MFKFVFIFNFVLLASFDSSNGINVKENGDIGYQCVTDFDHEISRLTDSDLDLVDELTFVFAMYRHGNRYADTLWKNIFPNDDSEFECNVKRVYSNVDQDGELSDYRLQFNYEKDEQKLKNSDCAYEQIADTTPREMIETGKILANRYFSTDGSSSSRSSSSSSGSSSGEGNVDRDQFGEEYRSPEHVGSTAIEEERVIESHVFFMQGLLGPSKSSNNVLQCDAHDFRSSVWRGSMNDVCRNTDGTEFNNWRSRYSNSVLNDQLRNDLVSTNDVQTLISDFESEGGIWVSDEIYTDIAFYYCVGVDIPLTQSTFDNLFEFAREYDSTYDTSENGEFLNKCVSHQYSRVTYNKVLEELERAIDGTGNKMYAVCAQGNPMRNFLFGLGMFNGESVRQNEIITLEVYKAAINDDNIDYYFRFTRDGDYIEFPGCSDSVDGVNNQLCDLNVLLTDEFGFSDAVGISEWEDICLKAETDCLCGLCDV